MVFSPELSFLLAGLEQGCYSKGASEVPWVLGLQLGPPLATGFQEPHSSVYLGSSLLMMEGPVRAVDWVIMVAVDGDGDHSSLRGRGFFHALMSRQPQPLLP